MHVRDVLVQGFDTEDGTLAALLISIEPLIDMARTALNVNGAMTAGVITGRLVKDLPAAVEGGGETAV